MKKYSAVMIFIALAFLSITIHAQIGKRFPSERKEVIDPVTGVKLIISYKYTQWGFKNLSNA